MTDQNRGAYTPQSDAPLSFDARRAGGKSGPMPITLIFSALILLALLVVGGGVAVLYHNGARKAGQPPQPVGQAVGTMKAAPEACRPRPRSPIAPGPQAPPGPGLRTRTSPPRLNSPRRPADRGSAPAAAGARRQGRGARSRSAGQGRAGLAAARAQGQGRARAQGDDGDCSGQGRSVAGQDGRPSSRLPPPAPAPKAAAAGAPGPDRGLFV